jgi:hypothetical protein
MTPNVAYKRIAFVVCGALFLCTAILYAANETLTVTILSALECGDGIDNDGDSDVDFPDDLGCVTAEDDSEAEAPSSGGGGGGGGGGGSSSEDGETKVIFRGDAYPHEHVAVLQNGEVIALEDADKDGDFQIEISDVSPGTRTYLLYAVDHANVRSNTISVTVEVPSDETTLITDLFLPPTLRANLAEVRRGEIVTLSGQAQAGAVVTLSSAEGPTWYATANSDGRYSRSVDTSTLSFGEYTIRAVSTRSGRSSEPSAAIVVRVGLSNEQAPSTTCPERGDVNSDCRVNLTDFSIAAYWWNRTLTEDAKTKVDARLWPDNEITLRDFSILAYHWSG